MAFDNQPNRNQQAGTGFTNLSRIIGANQSNQLASAVGGGVSNQVDQAKTGIQTASNDFNQKANAAKIATDANKQEAQTLINDPTQATDKDAKDFETFRSGRYDGPTELANKQQLTNQANQASTLGQMAGTAEGRQGLLQRFVGGAGYTQGKQRLDSMLLGQSGNADLKGAYRDARGLNQEVNSANTTAEEQAKQIAAQNLGFANQTKTALGNSVNQIYDTGQTRMADWTKGQNDLINGITTAGAFDPNNPNAGINLTSAQYNALVKGGYDPSGENSYLYNENLGDLISKSGFNPTLNSALTAQDAAKAQALAKLYGSDINEKGTNLLANVSDPSQLGTLANANQIDYNGDLAAQQKSDAQENMLRQYFSSVAPGIGTGGIASNDEFIDNIKNKGILSPFGTNYQPTMGGYNSINLSSDPASSSLWTAGVPTPEGADTYLNAGANYADKSNLEKAIDQLRAGESGSNYLNGMYGNGTVTANGDGILNGITGLGIGNYANQFGRLRQLINPNSEVAPNVEGEVDPVTGKLIPPPVVG